MTKTLCRSWTRDNVSMWISSSYFYQGSRKRPDHWSGRMFGIFPAMHWLRNFVPTSFGPVGISGEAGREVELLAYTLALLPHYGEDWWMMSMHALALCETGQIATSASLMDKSLALNPRNANAAHFKAHAQYEAGEIKAGRTYLTKWLLDYDDRGVMHGHLSWHTALWALHDGDEATLLRSCIVLNSRDFR